MGKKDSDNRDCTGSGTANGNTDAPTADAQAEPLPPLSMKDFQTYNRMAVQMDRFHTHFHLAWNDLKTLCSTPSTNKNTTRKIILTGLSFCSQLDFHHSIEEENIFPVLGRRMPQFRAGSNPDLLRQHKQIHEGLEKLEGYLESCRSGENVLDVGEVKRLMERFEGVLWGHLDEEVRVLGAGNMRRFWTLKEMPGLPM